MLRTKATGVALGIGQMRRLRALERRYRRTRSELVREGVELLLRQYERRAPSHAEDEQVGVAVAG